MIHSVRRPLTKSFLVLILRTTMTSKSVKLQATFFGHNWTPRFEQALSCNKGLHVDSLVEDRLRHIARLNIDISMIQLKYLSDDSVFDGMFVYIGNDHRHRQQWLTTIENYCKQVATRQSAASPSSFLRKNKRHSGEKRNNAMKSGRESF